MRRVQRRVVLVFACALLGSLGPAGCGHGRSPAQPDAAVGPTPDGAPGDPMLVGLTVDPTMLTLAVGETHAITVTGTFDDGSMHTITDGLTWASSADAVASVSSTGVATGVAEGSARITVHAGSHEAGVDVTVSPAAGSVLPVFEDNFGSGVSFAPFGGASGVASVDTSEHHSGTAALRIDVPASGYTGGALKLDASADLSGFDAVTFWARASKAASFNVVGLGNDAAGGPFAAEWNAVPLTTTWTRLVLPIPLAEKLIAERGLFHFAEGAEEGAYTIWLDDIRYEKLGAATLGAPAPAIATETVNKLVGDTTKVNGTSVTWTIDGAHETVAAARSYFSYLSSAPAVATVDQFGQVVALGVGSATITAKLGTLDAVGALTVQVAPVSAPDTGPTAPTLPAADVISLFSNAYTNVAVDTWHTGWSNAQLTELQIAGDDVKKYSSLVFVGVEFFTTAPVDATTMTHFHVDVWTPDATVVRVKLVDFGANAAFGGGDDSEHELSFDAASTPALVSGAWLGLDLPLASFTGMTARAHLAQLILSSSSATVYVDNVYFHR